METDVQLECGPAEAVPRLGDRVRFRGSCIPAVGTVVDERGEWHVIVRWDDTPNLTTHWRQSLEIAPGNARPAPPHPRLP